MPPLPQENLLYFFPAGSELARKREKRRQEWKTVEQTGGMGGGVCKGQRVIPEKGSPATLLSCVQGCTLGITLLLYLCWLSNGTHLFPTPPHSTPLRTSLGSPCAAREPRGLHPRLLCTSLVIFLTDSGVSTQVFGGRG